MKLVTPLKVLVLAMMLVALAVPGALASPGGVHGYISGRVTTAHNVNATELSVILVNASNTSADIPGFNATCDQFGFFQFIDVPAGSYKAFAWGPYLSAGMSNNITVDDNVTYPAAIVLVPQPYYGNMTVSKNPIPLEGAKTEITITVYDYWENPVGPGWMVSTHTTSGLLDPLYGLTDTNSQFKTTLTSPDNGSYAEVREDVRGWNGSYYPLQKRIQVVNATPSPSTSPSPTAQPTAQPCATPTLPPTATPNATATPVPSASPTATPKPAPGFELAIGLIALALAGHSRMRK